MKRRSIRELPLPKLQPRLAEHHFGGSLLTQAVPVLLADQARTADDTGTCAACAWRYAKGDRIARLADGSGWAHVSCIGRSS